MSDEKFTRFVTQDNYISEKIDVIKNNLLGNYDEENNYFISPQIINELKNLKKYKNSSFNNSAFCAGNLLGYGEILFELEFDEQTTEDNKGKANFYVLENVDKINGYLQNVIKTKIGEFVAPLDDFITKSYAFFNIFEDEDNDEGKEKKSLDDLQDDDSFILAKKQFSLLLDKLSNDLFLDAYGKYFQEKIKLLTSINNDFCKAVLEKFNQEYELIEKLFLTNKNYRILNELLDKCFEEISGTKDIYIEQEKSFREGLASSLETFTNNIEDMNEKFEEKALNMLSKDDKTKIEEIFNAEEEHNKQIKDVNDVDNTEIEIQNEQSEEVVSNENDLAFDMFTTSNEEGIQENIEEVTEEIVSNESNEVTKNESNVDMDMMKSMFGIDPTFVDDRPKEEPESDEEKESLDIMDMFRKKAEILATSPEYNGEKVNQESEEVVEDVESADVAQDEFLEESINEQNEDSETKIDDSETKTEEKLEEKEVKNISDIFNTLKNMSKEKTSAEKSPYNNETNIKEEIAQVEDFFDKTANNLPSENTDSLNNKLSSFEDSQNPYYSNDVSKFDSTPVFEDPSLIMEDEIYSDGIGAPLNIGGQYQKQVEEVEGSVTTPDIPTIMTDELGVLFNKSQDNAKIQSNSNEIDLNMV